MVIFSTFGWGFIGATSLILFLWASEYAMRQTTPPSPSDPRNPRWVCPVHLTDLEGNGLICPHEAEAKAAAFGAVLIASDWVIVTTHEELASFKNAGFDPVGNWIYSDTLNTAAQELHVMRRNKYTTDPHDQLPDPEGFTQRLRDEGAQGARCATCANRGDLHTNADAECEICERGSRYALDLESSPEGMALAQSLRDEGAQVDPCRCPAVEGWYWFTSDFDNSVGVVQVIEGDDYELRAFSGWADNQDCAGPVAGMLGEWAGPLHKGSVRP